MKAWLIFLIIVLVFCPVQAQDTPEVGAGEAFRYVYMEFQGPHTAIRENIGVFFQEIRKQRIQSKLKGDLFGVFFDSAIIEADRGTTWGLGFKIESGCVVHPPLKTASYDYPRVVRMMHRGPYEMVGLAINTIVQFIEQNRLRVIGPPLEIWLDENPNQTPPEDRRTEIIIPVEKKTSG